MKKIKSNSTAKSLLEDVLVIIKNKSTISLIELDLALDKLRQAYDLIYFEKTQVVSKTRHEESIQHEKIEDFPGPIEIEEEIQLSESENSEIAKEELISEIEFVVEGKSDEDKKKEPLKDVVLPSHDDNESLVDEEKEPAPESEENENSPDLFSNVNDSDSKDTLVDAISRDIQKETLVDQFQKNKIKHLREAIGINEKFFFLNELFDGDLSKYNEAIDSLDQFSSKHDAEKLIESLSEQYQWKDHDQAYDQFLEFINRKFSEA